MMTPQKPKGQQAGASAAVNVARKLLEQSLVSFGSDSEEGAAVLKAIHALAKGFARDEENSQSLMPAELKSALLAGGPMTPPGPNAGPPQGGPPGAPPGGAPPPPM
jgi:hypothetical protein